MDEKLATNFRDASKTLVFHASLLANLATRIIKHTENRKIAEVQSCMMIVGATNAVLKSCLRAVERQDLLTVDRQSRDAFQEAIRVLLADVGVCLHTCQDVKFQMWEVDGIDSGASVHMKLLKEYAKQNIGVCQTAVETFNLVLDVVVGGVIQPPGPSAAQRAAPPQQQPPVVVADTTTTVAPSPRNRGHGRHSKQSRPKRRLPTPDSSSYSSESDATPSESFRRANHVKGSSSSHGEKRRHRMFYDK